MSTVEFFAFEYEASQTFAEAHYRITGDQDRGFRVLRGGQPWLEVGAGYQLLLCRACGVCSTDLDRHHLPFALPQITGHEVVASDRDNQRCVVEINASHRARGVDSGCPFCAAGLERHCPDRLVLGIHDLPGGFGPWVLAPIHAVHRVPTAIPTRTAVLIEPFAAALHAVTTVAPRAGERVAVLGPRRLGLLVIAALAGHRRRTGTAFQVVALSRHPWLLDLSQRFGADETVLVYGDGFALPDRMVDCVIDTTGSPLGLELALHIARREVHLKSTHGRIAVGLEHLTELVVDELTVAPYTEDYLAEGARGAWLVDEPAPGGWRLAPPAGDLPGPAALLEQLAAETAPGSLPRVARAVVGSPEMLDRAIRPSDAHERSLLQPRGQVLVHPKAELKGSPLLAAVLERQLRVSSSRCGDFAVALDLLAGDPELRDVGDHMITHAFSASELARAFRVARSEECIKAMIEHDEQRR